MSVCPHVKCLLAVDFVGCKNSNATASTDKEPPSNMAYGDVFLTISFNFTLHLCATFFANYGQIDFDLIN